MTGNPYQGVIDWLRSAEGCRWSEERLARASVNDNTLIDYSGATNTPSPLWLAGVFSIKEDG